MITMIKEQMESSFNMKKGILENGELLLNVQEVAKHIIEAYKEGKKVMIAGNGGSAADAQHMAGEFVSKFYFDRPGLSAIALTTDTSILTAIGNDYGYEKLFARQIQANGNEGDIFIGISTSGNSKNIVEAFKMCKEKNIITVGLTGERSGIMDVMCDFLIKMPSSETPRIQEGHILVEHIICALVEKAIFGEGF